jgi:hypothetical protein
MRSLREAEDVRSGGSRRGRGGACREDALGGTEVASGVKRQRLGVGEDGQASAQSYKGFGVVVDGKWWKTRWLSSCVNSRAALLGVAAACLVAFAWRLLRLPLASALAVSTFGRCLLFLLENTVLGSTRQPLSSLCIALSALSFVFRCTSLSKPVHVCIIAYFATITTASLQQHHSSMPPS